MTTFAPRRDGDAANAPTAPEVLEEVRVLVEPAMRAAINRLHPRLALVESYHRGWTTAREAREGLFRLAAKAAVAL